MAESLRLRLEDFGPVKRGDLEFSRVTVFIGRNNTGKSYTAMLYYAIVRSLQSVLSFPFRFTLYRHMEHVGVDLLREIAGLLESIGRREDIDALVSRLEPLTPKLLSVLSTIFTITVREAVVREIERVYSAHLRELVRSGANEAHVEFECEGGALKLTLKISWNTENRVDVETTLGLVDSMWFARLYALSLTRRLEILETNIGLRNVDVVTPLLDALKLGLERCLPGSIRYLPASRAGLLQGYRALTSAILSLAPLAAIRGLELPGFTGPAADFLAVLVTIEPGRGVEGDASMLKLLEDSLLEGRVDIVRESLEKPPTLLYRWSRGVSMPLTRASSMVGELAPLDIYLRYGVVRPGDMLVIEEPEAHLHPEKQAKLAELFALLANRMRLRLLITTHSEILLAKLSNLVSLSALPPGEIEKLGFSRDVALDPVDVSVYHFVVDGDGVVVERLPVSEEGIPDDAFRNVIDDLYRETLDLHYALQRVKRVDETHGREA